MQRLYCTQLFTVRLFHCLGAKTEQAKAQVWGMGQGWVRPCSRAAPEESSSPERDFARDPGLPAQDRVFAQLSLGVFQTVPGKAPLPDHSGLRDTEVVQPTLSKTGDQIRKHFCWTEHLHISTHSALPSTMGHEGQGAETLQHCQGPTLPGNGCR